jgi:transposase InsO family protein
MVNFYRRFIPTAANILLPLTDALRADWSWVWAPAMQHSFQLVKDTLAEVATLTHPDPAADLSLAVDASNTHIGAVLQQWQPGGGGRSGGWRPLSFFSKKLDAAQLKYSAFDRELLAAYLSLRHFRYMLDGRKFHILSDHKPLTQALHRVSDPWTPRVQRQLSFLAELTSDVRHVPGKANVVADALSRPPPSAVASVKEPSGSLAIARQGGKPNTSPPSVPEQQRTATAAAGAARPPLSAVASVNVPAGSLATARQRGKPNPLHSASGAQPAASAAAVSAGPASAAEPRSSPAAGGLDLGRLAEAQASCADTQAAAASTSLQIKLFQVDGKDLICDISLSSPRPLVPVSFRRAVFDHIHSIAHPGIRATKRMVSARFVWRGMAADIAGFCRDCQRCARGKVTSTVHTQVQPIQLPVKRFSHVHIDIVGPLPASPGGCTHLLTMVDRSTRWAEAVPLVNTSTSSCAAAFFNSWVSRFGVPATLTSDRGVQFTSAVWAELCSTLGISHRLTTAYHPQANGLVERFHRQLKEALRARLDSQDWPSHLPWVMLGLRSAPKEDCGLSSAEMVYGEALTLPGEFLEASTPPGDSFLQLLRERMSSFQPPPTRPVEAKPVSQQEAALHKADYVYVKKGAVASSLSPLYSGPYRVISRGEKTFQVDIGGRAEVITADRLKPHLGQAPVQPAQPPRRGRPPASPSGGVGGRGRPPE